MMLEETVDQSGLLLSAIVAAALTLALAGGVALGGVARRARRRAGGLPAAVLCPHTGHTTLVRIGLSPDDGRLDVLECDCFKHGPVECDRACFALSPPSTT